MNEIRQHGFPFLQIRAHQAQDVGQGVEQEVRLYLGLGELEVSWPSWLLRFPDNS